MNNINITGNLTKDIEVRSTQSGISVCSFTVAVKRPHTSDTTDFIPCTAWRQTADFLGKYAHKGSKVGISGALTSRNYEDKNGNKRTAFEIVADSVELCESRSNSQGQNYTTKAAKTQQTQNSGVFEQEMGDLIEIVDEELPF